MLKDVLNRDEMHQALSKIYFETRKAIEYWKDKDKRKKISNHVKSPVLEVANG